MNVLYNVFLNEYSLVDFIADEAMSSTKTVFKIEESEI